MQLGQGKSGAQQGVCYLRLAPPTSGLARRRRKRGAKAAKLDGEFALYAARRRLRAWPGGDDGGGRSWSGWTGSLLPTPCSFDFRAWPGGGGGGGRSWQGSLLSAPLAADLRPDPEAAAEGGGAGGGVCSLRLTPPTSGLSRRRRWRGAELDGPGGVCSLYLEPPSFFFNPASSTGATKQVWLTRRRPSESPPIRRRGSGLQS